MTVHKGLKCPCALGLVLLYLVSDKGSASTVLQLLFELGPQNEFMWCRSVLKQSRDLNPMEPAT